MRPQRPPDFFTREYRIAFTLVELLAVIAIISLLIALLLPAMQAARESGRRAGCLNNIKQMSHGMQLFNESLGVLPPAPSDCCHGTWLVALLPYMEEQNVFQAYIGFGAKGASTPAAPWYHLTPNTAVTTKQFSFATCPSDQISTFPSSPPLTKHNYAVNYGNTGIDASSALNSTTMITPYGYQIVQNYNGVTFAGAPFESGKKVPVARIRDGLTNTLLLSEFVNGISRNSSNFDVRGLIWWGDNAGFSAYLAPNALAPDVYAQANYCQHPHANNPPAVVATSALNAVMYGARSRHPGGVGVAMCDGSVHFVADSIELSMWRDLSTTAGKETTVLP